MDQQKKAKMELEGTKSGQHKLQKLERTRKFSLQKHLEEYWGTRATKQVRKTRKSALKRGRKLLGNKEFQKREPLKEKKRGGLETVEKERVGPPRGTDEEDFPKKRGNRVVGAPGKKTRSHEIRQKEKPQTEIRGSQKAKNLGRKRAEQKKEKKAGKRREKVNPGA